MALIKNEDILFSIQNLKVIDPEPPVWIRVAFKIEESGKKLFKIIQVAEEDVKNFVFFTKSFYSKTKNEYYGSSPVQIFGEIPANECLSQGNNGVHDLDHNYFTEKINNNSFKISFYPTDPENRKIIEFTIKFNKKEIMNFTKELELEIKRITPQ